MEHINTVCRNEGYPIVVENSPQLGNHAVASRDIPQGEGLLRAIPYAAEVFDNYKKRMCQVCLLYHNRGSFTHRCQDCDQVYFCSEACKTIAMDPKMGCHLKVCRTLRKLATWNSDRHTKSIIKLLLQVLMNHWREREGIPTGYQSRKALMKKEKAEMEMGKGVGCGSYGSGAEGTGLTEMVAEDAKATTEEVIDILAATTITPATPITTASTPQTPPQAFSESNNDSSKDDNRVQEPVENDFFDVLRLQSHFEDWDDEDQKDWNKQSHIVLSLLEMAGLTQMASAPRLGSEEQELHTLTSLDVKKLISALESNAFGMFDRTKKKPVCFGRAIYPIASFFNHSCECNATAVQADGSTEEITGDAVLGLIEQEEEESNNKKVAAAGTTTPSSSSLSTKSESGSSTPLESGTATPVEEEVGGGEGETALPDPYDLRVGEFRMMTFFSIRDILKGQDITISYIDTEMPLQARRLALLSDYHFHCCCERCIREEKSGPTKTPKPAKKKSTPPKPKNKRK